MIEDLNKLGKKLEIRAVEVRSKLDKKHRGSGNVGIAALTIENSTKYLKAYSGYDEEIKGKTDGFVLLKESREFKTEFINNKNEIDYENGYDRKYDTESKLIEEIAILLGNSHKIEGRIDLYTDRIPCLSCMSVLKSFKKRYTEIKLFVYYKEVVNFEIKGE